MHDASASDRNVTFLGGALTWAACIVCSVRCIQSRFAHLSIPVAMVVSRWTHTRNPAIASVRHDQVEAGLHTGWRTVSGP